MQLGAKRRLETVAYHPRIDQAGAVRTPARLASVPWRSRVPSPAPGHYPAGLCLTLFTAATSNFVRLDYFTRTQKKLFCKYRFTDFCFSSARSSFHCVAFSDKSVNTETQRFSWMTLQALIALRIKCVSCEQEFQIV
jgi:hypothetical protein